MLDLKSLKARQFAKPLLFIVLLIPFGQMVWGAFTDNLGTNPVETLTHSTGDWTLRCLLLTLLITPLRRFSGMVWLVQLRRMLGLYTFFYACLHFLTYIWFDQYFDLSEIVKDVVKRPFITVGFLGFLLLVPLAFTSTNKMMRRLGKRWKQLHKLVYIIAILGILHFIWLVKADIREPMLYLVIYALLMLARADIKWVNFHYKLNKRRV